MSFRSSLRDFGKGGVGPVRFPEKTAMERAKLFLQKELGNAAGTLKPPEDLDVVAARAADRLEKGQALELRDLHRMPWCIWHAAIRERTKLVKALLDQIEERRQRRSYRALAAAWLYHFKPGAFAVSLIGDFLARNAECLGFPYTEAQATYYLFDAQGGPSQIADIAISTGQTPDAILYSANIRGNAVGYREETYRKGFSKLHSETDPAKRLKTIETWIWEDSKKVRFDTLRADAVSAALKPFGYKMPSKEDRDRFLAFALDLLGDPRIGETKWEKCKEAREIACRWLTEQSLRQFFEVVDRVAKPEHWEYRRAFWNALYELHCIENAWVIFEDTGVKTARTTFGKISLLLVSMTKFSKDVLFCSSELGISLLPNGAMMGRAVFGMNLKQKRGHVFFAVIIVHPK